MNILLKFRFSSYKLPYNFRGVSPTSNMQVQSLIEQIFGTDIAEGYRFAFRGVLECLNSEDQFNYLTDNCDTSLKSNWLQAVNKHKINLLNSNVNELTYFGSMKLHLWSDTNKPLSEQTPMMNHKIVDSLSVLAYKNFTLGQGLQLPRPIVSIETYIKSQSYLEIDGQSNKDGFHYVEFRTHSDSQINIMEYQEIVQSVMKNINDNKQRITFLSKFFTDDIQWKISQME